MSCHARALIARTRAGAAVPGDRSLAPPPSNLRSCCSSGGGPPEDSTILDVVKAHYPSPKPRPVPSRARQVASMTKHKILFLAANPIGPTGPGLQSSGWSPDSVFGHDFVSRPVRPRCGVGPCPRSVTTCGVSRSCDGCDRSAPGTAVSPAAVWVQLYHGADGARAPARPASCRLPYGRRQRRGRVERFIAWLAVYGQDAATARGVETRSRERLADLLKQESADRDRSSPTGPRVRVDAGADRATLAMVLDVLGVEVRGRHRHTEAKSAGTSHRSCTPFCGLPPTS